MVDIKRIKALMGANDHTKRFLAKYLKVSETTISKKVSGKVEFKASELKSVADLYGITLDELMTNI